MPAPREGWPLPASWNGAIWRDAFPGRSSPSSSPPSSMDSPLRGRMLALGGVFAASPLPVSFGDPAREAQAALSGCVATDRSNRGCVRMLGEDRLDLLHRLT